MIYAGPLGQQSRSVIEYFEVSFASLYYILKLNKILWLAFFAHKILLCQAIPEVSKVRDNYNPATWMLEMTSLSSEAEIGVDFAQLYKESKLHE